MVTTIQGLPLGEGWKTSASKLCEMGELSCLKLVIEEAQKSVANKEGLVDTISAVGMRKGKDLINKFWGEVLQKGANVSSVEELFCLMVQECYNYFNISEELHEVVKDACCVYFCNFIKILRECWGIYKNKEEDKDYRLKILGKLMRDSWRVADLETTCERGADIAGYIAQGFNVYTGKGNDAGIPRTHTVDYLLKTYLRNFLIPYPLLTILR